VWQAIGGETSGLSALLGRDIGLDGTDKAALIAKLASPRNALLAEAATLSPAMRTLFSDQAYAEVEASVRACMFTFHGRVIPA
jgi:hypothetical protein